MRGVAAMPGVLRRKRSTAHAHCMPVVCDDLYLFLRGKFDDDIIIIYYIKMQVL